jgi:hypothetical protein
VFQALSRTVQNIRATAVGTMSAPLKESVSGGGVEVGAETTPIMHPRRPKSAGSTTAPSVDSAATKSGHHHHHHSAEVPPSLNRSRTPPPTTTMTKVAQPKPIRISRSGGTTGGRLGGGSVFSHFSGGMNPHNNLLFDSMVSPSSSDPFVVSSLRDDSRMNLSGRRARDFF